MITLSFAPARVTSQSGDPLEGPASFTVETEPFSVTARSSTTSGSQLTPGSAILLSFNNHPRRQDLPANIDVRTGAGEPLAVRSYPDSLDDTRWYVVPADCLGAWPSGEGGELLLTVAASAADLYGRTLSAPLETRFAVSAPATPATAATPGTCDGGAERGDE